MLSRLSHIVVVVQIGDVYEAAEERMGKERFNHLLILAVDVDEMQNRCQKASICNRDFETDAVLH